MTTADVLGFVSLLVALVAVVASVIAIRRDRAYLVVVEADTAAGSRYLRVVNVGLRPVRITDIATRRHRWLVWVTPSGFTGWAGTVGPDGAAGLPVIVEPAAEVVLHIPNPANFGLPQGPFAVVDASGRFYWPQIRQPRLASIPRPEMPGD